MPRLSFTVRAPEQNFGPQREDYLAGKTKSGPLKDRSERGKEGRGKVSGKAMQDEVEANARTLKIEETTILEEG